MPDFGKVVGRYLIPIIDDSDPDQMPQLVPLSGTVTFELNASPVIEATADPDPAIYGSLPWTAVLDDAGYLSTPSGMVGEVPLYRGVYMVANNDPDLNPTSTQYKVTYALSYNNTPVTMPSHMLFVPAGQTVDLGLITPPAASQPIGTSAAEAAAAIAVASLDRMLVSEDIRQVVRVTQAEYDGMPLPRPSDILYVVTS